MTRSYLVAGVAHADRPVPGGLRAAARGGARDRVAIREALAARRRRAPSRSTTRSWATSCRRARARSRRGRRPSRRGSRSTTPALTINKVCPSGLVAIATADQMIRAGEVEVVVAGGMESMTNAPYVVPGARAGRPAGPRRDGRHDAPRRAVVRLRGPAHGRRARTLLNAEYGVDARATPTRGRRGPRRAPPPRGTDGQRWPRRSCTVDVAGPRRPETLVERATRGSAPDTTRRAAGGAAARVHRGRHRDGGQRLPDQRRRAPPCSSRARRRSRGSGSRRSREIVAYGMSADRFASLHTVPALAMEKALKKASARRRPTSR